MTGFKPIKHSLNELTVVFMHRSPLTQTGNFGRGVLAADKRPRWLTLISYKPTKVSCPKD